MLGEAERWLSRGLRQNAFAARAPASGPAGGAYSAPPDILAWISGREIKQKNVKG